MRKDELEWWRNGAASWSSSEPESEDSPDGAPSRVYCDSRPLSLSSSSSSSFSSSPSADEELARGWSNGSALGVRSSGVVGSPRLKGWRGVTAVRPLLCGAINSCE